MDWAFNKRVGQLVPLEVIPDHLKELCRLSTAYGVGCADSENWTTGFYTEEAVLRSEGAFAGIQFRLREIFYDMAHKDR